MELKLKSTGNTSNFVSWLKEFKDIQPSLIVEVDVNNQEFIAKCFPPEKVVVKYSKISFEKAGYEFSSFTDNQGNEIIAANYLTETTDNRIKVAIYEILSKVINVTNMFSQTEHELVIDFDICNNVKYATFPKLKDATAEKEYQSTKLVFKSLSLTMAIKCAELSNNFQKCTDETFLTKVCNIGNFATYEVLNDTIANLIKISSLFSSDDRDKIKFYSKEVDGQVGLYAFDESNSSYDYLIGYHSSGSKEKTSTIIFKSNFLNATKGITDETLKITLDTAGSSRILIEGDNSKVVVASVQFS